MNATPASIPATAPGLHQGLSGPVSERRNDSPVRQQMPTRLEVREGKQLARRSQEDKAGAHPGLLQTPPIDIYIKSKGQPDCSSDLSEMVRQQARSTDASRDHCHPFKRGLVVRRGGDGCFMLRRFTGTEGRDRPDVVLWDEGRRGLSPSGNGHEGQMDHHPGQRQERTKGSGRRRVLGAAGRLYPVSGHSANERLLPDPLHLWSESPPFLFLFPQANNEACNWFVSKARFTFYLSYFQTLMGPSPVQKRMPHRRAFKIDGALQPGDDDPLSWDRGRGPARCNEVSPLIQEGQEKEYLRGEARQSDVIIAIAAPSYLDNWERYTSHLEKIARGRFD